MNDDFFALLPMTAFFILLQRQKINDPRATNGHCIQENSGSCCWGGLTCYISINTLNLHGKYFLVIGTWALIFISPTTISIY